MRDDRYREGEDAYRSGQSFRDNPYARECRASHLWAQGWRHAEREVDEEGLTDPSSDD
jgi:hypothetical protein